MTPTQIARFWNKVKKTRSCWLWTGAQFSDGYGQVTLNKRLHRAHRISYLLTFGVLPDNQYVLHTCDVKVCVKPAHLYLGDAADNARDREARGRGRNAKGEQHGNAKLTEAEVLEIRRRYIPYIVSQRTLAEEFGVVHSQISDIVNRKKWTHVT